MHPDEPHQIQLFLILWYVAASLTVALGAGYSALRSSRLARGAVPSTHWTDFYLVTFGRTSRRAFWLGFALPVPLIFLTVFILEPFSWKLPWASFAVIGASVWPGIAVGTKRLHDRDKSAWWLLILLIPVPGFLWYLIELGFFPGTSGQNRFGPPPPSSRRDL